MTQKLIFFFFLDLFVCLLVDLFVYSFIHLLIFIYSDVHSRTYLHICFYNCLYIFMSLIFLLRSHVYIVIICSNSYYITALEVLYNSRQSSLFDLMTPELKKSIIEIEEETERLIADS